MKRVFAVLGFSLAITLIILNLVPIKWALAILAVAGALFLISLAVDKTRNAISVPLCLFSAVLACVLFVSQYYGVYAQQAGLNGKTADIQFYICDVEEEHGDFNIYTVKTTSIDINGAPQNIKTELFSSEPLDADYYQLINGRVKFRRIADNAFDSYGYFADNIFLKTELEFAQPTDVHVSSPNKKMVSLRKDIREHFKNKNSDNAALALALITGDKSLLSAEIKEEFKLCGASHLMAVSGLHLSIVVSGIYFLLKRLRIPKYPRVFVTLFVIVFYSALTGFSKSVVRAGIMLAVLLIGNLFHQRADSLNSLGLAAFVICLNPYAVTDAGAMLTVTAVLGLLTIYPRLCTILKSEIKIVNYVVKTLFASFSVFVTTLPVMYYTFGAVSLIGMLLNIAFIPIAQIALVSSLFSLFPPIAFAADCICELSTGLLISIVKRFAHFGWSFVMINSADVGLAMCVSFLIFGIVFLFNNKKLLKYAAVVSAVAMAAIIASSYAVNYNNTFVREISGSQSTAYIVYNRQNAVFVGVTDNNQYFYAKELAETYNLDLSMIVDTKCNEYSRKLANEIGTANYAALPNDYAAKDVNCDNILQISEFNVDLWDELNIKYYYDINNNAVVTAKIYNSEFLLSKRNDEKNYDTVYTVNENGCKAWRINKWLK